MKKLLFIFLAALALSKITLKDDNGETIFSLNDQSKEKTPTQIFCDKYKLDYQFIINNDLYGCRFEENNGELIFLSRTIVENGKHIKSRDPKEFRRKIMKGLSHPSIRRMHNDRVRLTNHMYYQDSPSIVTPFYDIAINKIVGDYWCYTCTKGKLYFFDNWDDFLDKFMPDDA